MSLDELNYLSDDDGLEVIDEYTLLRICADLTNLQAQPGAKVSYQPFIEKYGELCQRGLPFLQVVQGLLQFIEGGDIKPHPVYNRLKQIETQLLEAEKTE